MLKMVTFTGADDSTNIDDLLHLSEAHPWIEWGILLPPAEKGGRFPGRRWVREFVGAIQTAPFKIRSAGHVCPPWTKLVLCGALPLEDAFGAAFDRVQINTHGEQHEFMENWIDLCWARKERQIILQLDGIADKRLEELGGGHDNITGLYDLSHGAGVLPATWPNSMPGSSWIGYAGGLGPDNLASQIQAILAAAGDCDVWIDMETKVRTDGKFDLAKVRECIAIAKPFVSQ